MRKLLIKIRQWYAGWVEINDNLHDELNPNFRLQIHPPSTMKKILSALIVYFIRNYQWLIIVALTAATLSYTMQSARFAELAVPQKIPAEKSTPKNR